MRIWQKAMIGLARSESVTRRVQASRKLTRFAGQFVGGEDHGKATLRAAELKAAGLSASLFYLGEYVQDPAEIGRTTDALKAVAAGAAEQGLDVHLSVDPTQIGSMMSWDECRRNAEELARTVSRHAAGGCDVLMLDMEDSSVVQPTLDLYFHLRGLGLPAAVTVQSYLHRTEDDLTALVADGAMVRLVKGAFAEPVSVAVTRREERDEAYRRAVVALFSAEAKRRGVRPVLGTHDHRMVEFARHAARAGGWSADEWEVEMLLGVRPQYQKELVEAGVSVRLYLPFGSEWFPYSIRRVGENPANLAFVLRAAFGS